MNLLIENILMGVKPQQSTMRSDVEVPRNMSPENAQTKRARRNVSIANGEGTKMVVIVLDNISVDFPYVPYDEQKKYMTTTIRALNQGKCAVLESPTGTGKTASLLCSTLAWVDQSSPVLKSDPNLTIDEDGMPTDLNAGFTQKTTVIYASRTHSQLSKALNELRNTPYKRKRAMVLGSREQMCVHPDLSSTETISYKNSFCRARVASRTCTYYSRVEAVRQDPSFLEITDIEDLVSKSKKAHCCPFYLARSLQDEAEIIFMPYNYLFDSSIRKRLKINLQNTVVILDEAHNVDKVCEEAASHSISSTQLNAAIVEVTKAMEEIHEQYTSGTLEQSDKSYSPDDLAFVKEKLLKVDSEMNQLKWSVDPSNGLKSSSELLFKLLSDSLINLQSAEKISRVLTALHDTVAARDAESNLGHSYAGILQHIADFFVNVLSIDQSVMKTAYRVYVEKESSTLATARRNKGDPIKVSLWCLTPSVGMKSLIGCHSVIVTSGTLAPLSVTCEELGLKDALNTSFTHIVSHQQFLCMAVPVGPTNEKLMSTYGNRENALYWKELGLCLINFLRIIPDGVLVFFPSYAALTRAVNNWKEFMLWDRLSALKPMYIESNDKDSFNKLVKEYRQSITDGKGAVMMGVCRGKVAEGMDFEDAFGRGVIVFGLAYPPMYDPKVTLKREYLNSLGKKDLTGSSWYSLEATRAVNQAVGRVIRHSKDFGVILLCDIKFQQDSVSRDLSKWLQPVQKSKNFGAAAFTVRQFFKSLPVELQKEVVQNPTVDMKNNSCTTIDSAPRPTYSTPSQTKPPSSAPLPDSPFDLPKRKYSEDIPSEEAKRRVLISTRSTLLSPMSSPSQPPRSCLEALAVEDSQASPSCSPKPSISSTPFESLLNSSAKLESVPAKLRKSITPMDFGANSKTKSNLMNFSDIRASKTTKLIYELKSNLEAESYVQFASVMKRYQTYRNFSETISKLSLMFPASDPALRAIFLDCESLFLGEHLAQFHDYCGKNYHIS